MILKVMEKFWGIVVQIGLRFTPETLLSFPVLYPGFVLGRGPACQHKLEMQPPYFTKGETEVHGLGETENGKFCIVSHFIFGNVPVIFSVIFLDSYSYWLLISLE